MRRDVYIVLVRAQFYFRATEFPQLKLLCSYENFSTVKTGKKSREALKKYIKESQKKKRKGRGRKGEQDSKVLTDATDLEELTRASEFHLTDRASESRNYSARFSTV